MKLLVISEVDWEKVSNEVIYSTGGKRKLRRAMAEIDTEWYKDYVTEGWCASDALEFAVKGRAE